MSDASFQDGQENPLRLRAESPEDLQVISALVQDAVLQSSEISWQPKRHRLALLINRFRWEDRDAAEKSVRPFERVRTMLVIDSALRVAANGIRPDDKDTILSTLALEFAPTDDGAGTLTLILAGDGAIAVDVECLDVMLQDVSRPYKAQAKAVPQHGEDG